MYAIFTDGSRQYRAEEGELVTIDYRDVKVGDALELDQVLLVGAGDGAKIGQPLVAGAKIVTEVVDFPKIKTMTQKFRRRKNSKRLRGHTQHYTRVRVKQIIG